MSIYACGDIHGQFHLYQKMLKGINFSDSDHLFIIGDAIDRGPDGVKLLLDIMNRKNVTLLLGNHELMMWDYYRLDIRNDPFRYKNRKTTWFLPSNGGRSTFNVLDTLPVQQQEEIFDFIEGLELQHELTINDKVFLLSHSDFIEDKATINWKDAGAQTSFDVVWDSPWRSWEYQFKAKYLEDNRTHIIGHVPTIDAMLFDDVIKDTKGVSSEVYIDKDNHIINIDCGCARLETKNNVNYRLCCMNITQYCADPSKGSFQYYS